jgi:catechol 2,3-dioxygenase
VHIARVALRVSDLDRSIDWYGRVAGLAPRDRQDGHVALGAPDGGPVLLELRAAERPGAAPRAAAGLFHTAFRYPTRAALGAALRRIVTGRESFTGASDHAVSEALYLDDPDGMGVELYRDRPREEWPRDGEGNVAMVTRPLDVEALLAG